MRAATAARQRLARSLLLLLPVSALGWGQAMPPPGVDAARPPTERTLRPSGKAQNAERVPLGQDCRKVEADMREQFRIQADAVRDQYAQKIAKAEPADHAALGRERDARIAALHAQGESAAKQFGSKCRADRRELLHAPVMPGDGR